MRNRALVRVLRLWRATSAKEYVSVAELAREFQVSTRTVRRDFEALEGAGLRVPHYADRREGVLAPRVSGRIRRTDLEQL